MRASSPRLKAAIWAASVAAPWFGLAHAETTAPASTAATSATAATSTVPLRKPRPEPLEIEVVDLSPEGDPQAFALGAQLGVGVLAVSGGGPLQATTDAAFVGEWGLGPQGKRVPWTVEPWLAFAMPINQLADKGGYPSRFTEFGARLVYRWDERGWLPNHWIGVGLGAVWSNTRPTSGFFDPKRRCYRDLTSAVAAGLDCSSLGNIAPGLLVDLSVGLLETTIRRARWGFGLRVPVQLSSHPGFGVLGFFYAQVGAAR